MSTLRELLERSRSRGVAPGGVARQLDAIFASGDRTAELHAITAPTLVIHGTADRIVKGHAAAARSITDAIEDLDTTCRAADGRA